MLRLKNQRGQGLVEYVILVALVGVASMGLVRVLQSSIRANLGNIIYALQADRSHHKVTGDKISDDDLKKADFGNFMKGAAGRGDSGGGDDN